MEELLNEKYVPLSPELEDIGKAVVDSAFAVHKNLGPGLLERVYEVCMCYELNKRGISTQRQLDIPIKYDGLLFNEGLRLDILAGGKVIVELKAVDQLNPVWQAQVLSHLKLTEKRLGYLINFNVPLIKHGIKRIVI